ncbi:MAG TPA: caspase family protein, partial [Polyangiaceae bacterium]|nr:caspase family protein [Polyangiaceae bacterium]
VLWVVCLVLACGRPTTATKPTSCEPWRSSPKPQAGRQLIQQQHSGEVWALVGLPGGMVASGGDDNTVRIWDLETRALVRVIPERQLVGHSLRGVIVEGYGGEDPTRDEVAVSDGRVIEADVDRERAVPGGTARPSIGVAGARPRWLGASSSSLVWFDAQRRAGGVLQTPWPASEHDLQPVDRLSVRAGFWWQNEVLVGELDPDGYGEKPASLVAWKPARGEKPWRVIPLPGIDAHLLGLDANGERALIYARGDLSLVDLESSRHEVLMRVDAPSHRIKVDFDGRNTFALVTGAELVVYDLFARKVRWRTRAAERSGSLMRQWHRRAENEQHLFADVAFSGNAVAVRSQVAVYAYDAATGRYRGDLGARPRFAASAPRFADEDRIVVDAGGHLQRWSLRDGTLEATADVPAYFDRAECTKGNLVRWCDVDYADAYHPLADGDLLRVRAAAMQHATPAPDDPAAALNRCELPGKVLGKPIVFERMQGIEPLASLQRVDIPALAAWPPPRGRTMICSPVHLDLFRIDEQIDVARGRIVGRRASGGAIVELASGRVVDLEGDAEPERWEGKLVSGSLRQGGARKAALWDDSGKLLWTAEHDDEWLVASDGTRAARARGKLLTVFRVAEGRELARVTLPEPCVQSIHGRASLWRGDDLVCGTRSGRLLRIRGSRVERSARAAGDEVRALAASPSGARFVTWNMDGLLRVWRADRLELLATLVELDGEALAFTPEGVYGGSPEAAASVAWVFDGSDKPEAFRFEQFAASFRRPELVLRRLAGESPPPAPLRRPPSARITKKSTQEGRASVVVEVTSPSRVDTVRLFVEGRERARRHVCAARAEVELEVPLVAGTNRLTAVAFDAEGLASNPAQIDVSSKTGERPDLYVVSIGVSRYPHLPAALQLDAAAADARALAAAFERQSGVDKAYRRTHRTLLLDEAVTLESIDRAVAGLARMRPSDVAIVFFAGHGVKPGADEDMVFLTAAARSTKADDVRRAGYGWRKLGERLAAVPGRVLVLLDACHSGHLTRELVIPNEAMAKSLAAGGRAGAVVFAASKGRQESIEANAALLTGVPARLGPHGVFTAALLASLSSADTDRDGDGAVQLGELVDDVTLRVSQSTAGRQTPWLARRELFGDFRVSLPR